jgi:hypothetical protein
MGGLALELAVASGERVHPLGEQLYAELVLREQSVQRDQAEDGGDEEARRENDEAETDPPARGSSRLALQLALGC